MHVIFRGLGIILNHRGLAVETYMQYIGELTRMRSLLPDGFFVFRCADPIGRELELIDGFRP